MSSTQEAVLQRLRIALPYLRRRYGVVRLSLYGSFARGAAVETSDVDLLVELSRPLGLEEIKEQVRAHARTLMVKYGIRVVGIFGSYTRGTQKRKSDIDLLAEIDRPISLLELVGAEIYLSEILQKKVDLVAKDDLREELRGQILSETIYL